MAKNRPESAPKDGLEADDTRYDCLSADEQRALWEELGRDRIKATPGYTKLSPRQLRDALRR